MVKTIWKNDGIGKSARKRKLARVAKSVESGAHLGHALSRAGVISAQDSKRHGAAMVAARREQWEGASHDGYCRHGRTFIRRTTAEYMNGRARLWERWSRQAGIVRREDGKRGRR